MENLKAEFVFVTPEYATELLSHNNINRKLADKRVIAYAKDIKDGKWQFNGESICIHEDGTLANGQHRLSAIVKAGIGIKCLIVTGIPKQVTLYDRGRNRSVSDTLLASGMDRTLGNNTNISIVKRFYADQIGDTNVSDSRVEEFLIKHSDTFYKVEKLYSGRSNNKSGNTNIKNSALMLAAFYAIECGVDMDILVAFFKSVHTGFYANENESSAIVLRKDISSMTIKGGQSYSPIIRMTEKAINDWVNKYPRKNSYKNCEDRIYSNNIKFKEDK